MTPEIHSSTPQVPALSVRDISIAFGGLVAVDAVSFDVPRGEIFSIIGPNGAGKTTLFNVVSGMYRSNAGTVRIDGVDVSRLLPFRLARAGLARTFQNMQIFPAMTAVENVMVGCARAETTSLWADLLYLPTVQRQNARSRAKALELLERLQLSHHADTPAAELSYGSLKRLEIARALATEPRLLLLDEPVAGCNAVETDEIVQIVKALSGDRLSVVLIEHDMKMVMHLSHRVLVLHQGKVLAEGSPDEMRRNPKVIEAYLGVHADEVAHAKR